MDRGYLKLWRKSLESEVFANEQLWRLWCLCLLKACHKEKFVTINGCSKPIKLIPGQFVTGRFALHKDYYGDTNSTKKSPITVWRWLQYLADMGNVNIKTQNKYSVITVENWHDYQGNDQQTIKRRSTDDQQMITNKNVKNVKNVKNSIGQKKFIPPSLKDVTAYCLERENGVDPQKWFDHYTAKGWMIGRNKMKDWKAAVRTWERMDPKRPKSFSEQRDDKRKQAMLDFANEDQ